MQSSNRSALLLLLTTHLKSLQQFPLPLSQTEIQGLMIMYAVLNDDNDNKNIYCNCRLSQHALQQRLVLNVSDKSAIKSTEYKSRKQLKNLVITEYTSSHYPKRARLNVYKLRMHTLQTLHLQKQNGVFKREKMLKSVRK